MGVRDGRDPGRSSPNASRGSAGRRQLGPDPACRAAGDRPAIGRHPAPGRADRRARRAAVPDLPPLASVMAQKSPNGGPSTPRKPLAFRTALAYDGSERPNAAIARRPSDDPATPGHSGGVMAKVYAVKDGSYSQNLVDLFDRGIALAEPERQLYGHDVRDLTVRRGASAVWRVTLVVLTACLATVLAGHRGAAAAE